MQEIQVGDPKNPSTDIGPIINKTSISKLNNHIAKLKKLGKEYVETKCQIKDGSLFINPIAFKIYSIS